MRYRLHSWLLLLTLHVIVILIGLVILLSFFNFVFYRVVLTHLAVILLLVVVTISLSFMRFRGVALEKTHQVRSIVFRATILLSQTALSSFGVVFSEGKDQGLVMFLCFQSIRSLLTILGCTFSYYRCVHNLIYWLESRWLTLRWSVFHSDYVISITILPS